MTGKIALEVNNSTDSAITAGLLHRGPATYFTKTLANNRKFVSYCCNGENSQCDKTELGWGDESLSLDNAGGQWWSSWQRLWAFGAWGLRTSTAEPLTAGTKQIEFTGRSVYKHLYKKSGDLNEWHNRREDTVSLEEGGNSLAFISIKDSTIYGLLGDDGSKSIISHNPMRVQQMVSKIRLMVQIANFLNF